MTAIRLKNEESSYGSQLTILILQYNSTDLTIQLLHSIDNYESSHFKEYRFIVMDNGSEFTGREMIEKRFPWVEFIEFKENLGFARAHNRIMQEIESEWVLMLNNDCVLLNDAITRTFSTAKKIKADFATCSVLNDNMSHQNNFSTLPTPLRRIFLNLTGISRLMAYFRRNMDVARVGYINGTFLLLNKSKIPQGILFDDRYFMYTEDLDLMYRLSANHAKGYRIAAGHIIHYGGQSAARRWKDQQIQYLKKKQAMDCMCRYFPAWQIKLARALYKIVAPSRMY